jgi:dipeptidase E
MAIFLISTLSDMKTDLHAAFQEEIASRGNKVAFVSTRPQAMNTEMMRTLIIGYQTVSPHIDINYFDIRANFNAITAVTLLRHSAIHIEPEDISEFMQVARQCNLKALLHDHVDKGGMLVGCGSGAIVLTPVLETAKIIDERARSLVDTTGLGHVDFEVLPHYSETDGKQLVITQYAKETQNRLFACHDGDGLKVIGGHMTLFGDTVEVEG